MADIFPTGYFAAKNAWTLLSEDERQDENLIAVVIGCGPVGLCAVTAACQRFPKVYAIDSVDERLGSCLTVNDRSREILLFCFC